MRWLALGINGRTVDGRRVCIEREVSGNQIRGVMVKYLDDNPERLHLAD